MPTGYTNHILQGATTREFMLKCARAFGALIHMRDDPSDKELPEEIPLDNYHEKRLAESKEQLAQIEALTPDEIEAQCEEDNESSRQSWERCVASANHQRLLYTQVLREVEAWEPPTLDHMNFKQFMIDQITESIKFDCRIFEKEEACPEPMSPEEWYEMRLEGARQDVKYHTKGWAKDQEVNAERNAWLNALLLALPEDQQGEGSASSSDG